MSGAEWIFERQGPQQEGSGGDPGERLVIDDFEDFIRESVQNSNDAIREKDGEGEMVFDFVEMEGEQLEEFKKNLGWSDLKEHIGAQEDSNTATRTQNFVEYVESQNKLRLLKIEDKDAIGLTGGEFEKQDRFWAFTRGTLRTTSIRSNIITGGTEGIGKSAYWAYSALETVLINSFPDEGTNGNTPPRFFAKSNLSDHELDSVGYTSSGYFGEKKPTEPWPITVSMWGEDAENISERLHVGRDGSTGTTLGIVGFEGPGVERDQDIQTIINEIDENVARYFWPRIVTGGLEVRMRTDGEEHSEVGLEDKNIEPFVECYRAYRANDFDDKLEEPGDIIREEVPVKLPDKTKDHFRYMGGSTKDAKADLVVMKAEENTENRLEGKVAMFRGAGMVVDYKKKSSIPGSGPFFAILVCGQARREEELDKGDKHFEQFLAVSEPSKHDKWQKTEKLKNYYENPGRIKDFHDAWESKLKDILTPEIEEGMKGPEDLSKKFPLGKRFGKGRTEKPVHFSNVSGWYEGNRFIVNGEISVDRDKTSGAWSVRVEMENIGDDEKKVDDLLLSTINVTRDEVSTRIEDGEGVVEIPEDIDSLQFSAKSTKVEDGKSTGEARANIRGRVTVKED